MDPSGPQYYWVMHVKHRGHVEEKQDVRTWRTEENMLCCHKDRCSKSWQWWGKTKQPLICWGSVWCEPPTDPLQLLLGLPRCSHRWGSAPLKQHKKTQMQSKLLKNKNVKMWCCFYMKICKMNLLFSELIFIISKLHFKRCKTQF